MRAIQVALIFTVGLTAGCMSVRRFNGLSLQDDAVFVSGVPPIHQDRDHACGPACVAAVAANCGVGLNAFSTKYPHLPADATAQDLTALAQGVGLEAFAYRGSMDDLAQNLRAGRPVIVMIPMPFVGSGLGPAVVFGVWNEIGPRPSHWVVVTGLISDHYIIVHDPASGPLLLARAEFEAWWGRRDNLCVLIVPKNAAVAGN